MAKNVSYPGGFIDMLASLAARALPTILTGLTTGLLSGGISKAISSSGTAGDGIEGDHVLIGTPPPLAGGGGGGGLRSQKSLRPFNPLQNSLLEMDTFH